MIRYIDSLVEGTDSIENIKYLIGLLPTAIYIGLDTETTGLDPYTSQVLLVQIKIDDEVFVLNRGKLGVRFITNIINLINKNNIICIGHNIKFDIKMLKVDTGLLISNSYDTMIIEAVLMSGLSGKFCSLLSLVKKYCDVDLVKDARLEFLEMNHDSIFTEQQITYAATDVLYLFDIYSKQMKLLSEANLLKIAELEMDLLPVVCKMELNGILLDVEYWNNLTRSAEKNALEVAKKIKELIFKSINSSVYRNAFEFAKAVAIPVKTKKLQSILESINDPLAIMVWVNEKFNLNSHKQLLTTLNLAGIDVEDTNEKTLNKLPKSDIIDTILEYRDYEKRISTYGDNVVRAINPVTGRIHADFNQVGTSTGRFSSSGGVNMQNIPTHNGYREGFVAKPGYSFIAMDYSQCEYRLAGALSKEPLIEEAYKSGYDMHTATAAMRFNVPFNEVTKEQRYKGKTINFAVLYGTTSYGLKRNLDISLDEAEELLRNFFAGYPKLTAFKNAVESMIVKFGYSITPMGRRRYFKPMPAIATPKEVERYTAQMKREGFNMVIQGGTADVLKIAMVNIDRKNPFGDKLSILLQVHDELVAEVEDSILKEAEDFMRKEMVDAFQPFLGQIPAVADGHISKRWEKT